LRPVQRIQPASASWTTLPRGSFYLPLIQSSTRYLAAGTFSQRNVAPGEPLVAMIDDAIEPRAELHGPGDVRAATDLAPIGQGREARFATAARPGIYRLEYKSIAGPRSLYFYVRGARDESDVRALDARQWDVLRRSLDLQVLEYDQPQAAAAALAGAHRRRELWPVLICAVIALALLEMGLANAWTRAPGVRA